MCLNEAEAARLAVKAAQYIADFCGNVNIEECWSGACPFAGLDEEGEHVCTLGQEKAPEEWEVKKAAARAEGGKDDI